MTWLHPALLAGLGLVTIPVLLHFLMRQKPKKLVFPALRLIQQQRRHNSKRFRLRHLWLLLLRMAALAALVLALARPTLPAANYGLSLTEFLTLAGLVLTAGGLYYWRTRPAALTSQTRSEQALSRSQNKAWISGLTVLAILLCVGWPYQRRVSAEITGPPPTGQFDLPVAAVLIFDTSLSLQYTQEGKSRLELARELAREHLQDFPAGSRIAIADNSNDQPVIFQASASAAQTRLNSLELTPVTISLNDRIQSALTLQSDDRQRVSAEGANGQDRFIRRVYVFTDLAASAWRPGASSALTKAMSELPSLNIQLVDVGKESPVNTALTGVTLSRQMLNHESPLAIWADVQATGDAGERTLVLSLQAPNGQLVPRDTTTVTLEAGQAQRVGFQLLTGLTGPVIHGEVRLQSSDPMSFDDVRSFTAVMAEPAPVVLVSPQQEEAREVYEALSVLGYSPIIITPLQLATADLAQYQMVYLLNVPQLSDDTWNRLGSFVQAGGGLAVVLGDANIDSLSYNRGAAQQLLPARLDVWQGEQAEPYRIAFDRKEHPLLWKLRALDPAYSSFAAFEGDMNIYRFWKTTDRASDSSVVASYSDAAHSAALLDRPHGLGRTVMFTSGMHLPSSNLSRWNDLPSPNKDAWLWLAFVEQMAGHLARATDWQFNLQAGESATLPVTPTNHDQELLLQKPGFIQSRLTLKAGSSLLQSPDSQIIGNYSVTVPGHATAVTGYSVNAAASESDLTPATPEQFEELFGAGRFQIARTLSELKADVNISDLGKEVYPLILLLAVLAFCTEHFVANWFYENRDGDSPTGPKSAVAGKAATAPALATSAPT